MKTSLLKAQGWTIVGVLTVMLCVGVPSASADSFTFDLTGINQAGFTGPFVQVTVTTATLNSTTATIAFMSLTNGGFLYLLGGQDSVGINTNGPATVNGGTGGVTYTPVGLPGFTTGTATSIGSGNINGWGTFDLTIQSFDGFTNSSPDISFDITKTSGTWANAASVLTANGNDNIAGAHVFPCPEPNCSSGSTVAQTAFVAGTGSSTPPTETPEPGSLLLLGSGLAGLAAWNRKRRG